MATSGRPYSDAVGQFEAHLVVRYGGDDVAVTSVFNGFSQFDSISIRAVADLEAVFFQVVQLTTVDGFFAVGSNRAIRYVTQGNRTTCSIAYQVHLVARGAGWVTCGVNVGHRGVELNLGDAASARDFGYGALAVGEVDGVAVGHEVFVLTVTLYGKACVQYVINGSSIIAFVTSSQGGTIVVGRIGGGSSGISQIALHVSQGGRVGSVAGCILHAGNHVANWHLVTCTVGRIVELAVGVFVDLAAISFGVYHRGLRVLHHRLGVQGVGVALVTVGVQVLFYGQSVACFEGQCAARFGGGGNRRITYGVAASGDVEAAVVDGVGNVAGSGQFIGICTSRSNHLTGRVTIITVTYIQCSSIGCYFIGGAAGSCIHVRGNANTVAGSYLAGSGSLSSFQLAYVHCVGVGRTGRYIGDAAVKGFPHPGRIVATNRYFAQLYTGSSNAGNVGVCRWFIGRGGKV